jgi:hypothetical protein
VSDPDVCVLVYLMCDVFLKRSKDKRSMFLHEGVRKREKGDLNDSIPLPLSASQIFVVVHDCTRTFSR